MRIISGKYKGRRVYPPKKFPSRPTTDMAKEALFNILENQCDWEDLKVLDLFAGTGNVSLEFLSREVKEVLSIDSHHISIRHLNKVRADLAIENWTILRKDVFKYVKDLNSTFDIIFADPPFGDEKTDGLPDLILNSTALAKNGIFILEHGQENSFSNHPNCYDSRNYGGVFFSFFR